MKFSINLLIILSLTFNLFSQEVSVIRTDGDGSERLTPQNSFQLNQSLLNNPDIVINENDERQEIDGFGYMLTQGSAEAILSLSSDKQDEVINEFFNPNSNQKVSIVRISIGASDLSNSTYSYNDNPGDIDMSEFSLAGPDLEYLLPVLKKIIALNPDIRILATPWSAPKWMKTENSWTGGRLKSDMMEPYALYFRKYLEAMNAEGIEIWGITVQNEPENGNNEPSMLMNSLEQIDFINNHLKTQIENLPFATPKIIGFDHNCDNTDFPSDVANSSPFIDGSAFHLYAGDISALSEVHDRTNKNIYFTEQFTSSNGDFNSDFGFHIEEIIIGSLRNWSRIVLEWNLSSFADFTPKTPGGCDECLGAVTIDGGDYIRNVSYYIIAQVSRFVDPGARVLASTNGMSNVAFKNPDGSIVILVFNRNDNDRNIVVNSESTSFSYNVPGRSAITFKWQNRVPNVPTGLNVTAVFGRGLLDWDAALGADSYDVFRSVSLDGPFSIIQSDITSTSYEDRELESGVTYYYQVRAKNNVGVSDNSSTENVTILPHIQIIPDGNYMIFSRVNNEAIVTSNEPDFDVFMTFADTEDENQYWTLKHLEYDIYTIRNLKTGKFIGLNSNWCGIFGDLEANYQETDDNINFRIINSASANNFLFEIAFANCGGNSKNDPIKAWDIENGASGAQVQTFIADKSNINQQFELLEFDVISGIDKRQLTGNSFNLFPNPSSNVLYIKRAEWIKESIIVVIADIEGRVVSESNLSQLKNKNEINIAELKNGFYFITFFTEDRMKIDTKKISISRK